MKDALIQANIAIKHDEVPVGAIIIERASNKIIAKAFNQVETLNDPTAHAEILAIKEACRKKNSKFLENCDLYVTLEPCAMCAQAISLARISRLYFAAYDPKSGGVDHGAKVFKSTSCHFKPEIYGGIHEEEAAQLLQNFFKQKR